MSPPAVSYTAAEVANWAGGEVARGTETARADATSIDRFVPTRAR